MILHRSPQGVLSSNALAVVLRLRPNLEVARRASPDAFRSGALDGPVLEAFGLTALACALARQAIADAQGLLAFRLTTPEEHADRPSPKRTWTFGRGDPRVVWIRGRTVTAMAGELRYEASFAEHLATGFPQSVAAAFGADVVETVRASVVALEPLPCFCHTGAESIEQHGTLETIASKSDPFAPVDVRVAVARCTVCRQGWTFEASGDSHYDYSYSVHEFAPFVGYTEDETTSIVLGVRAGAEVMRGCSRSHTTYRGRDDQLFIEDFDEGMTDERACAESTLRAAIADEPEAFLEVLRKPLRARLRDALLAGDAAARARLGDLLALGESLTDPDLLVAVLAWPEKPTTNLLDGKSGLDVYHAVMSAIGYDSASPAAGQFGLKFFAVIDELRGQEDLAGGDDYRAPFRAMLH